jgi:large subunit ribosomal protein L24
MQESKPIRNPGKQRKMLFNAPAHIRHKLMAAPLSPELLAQRGIKTLPVRKGDTVRIMRGDHKGFEGKISRVDLKRYRVFLEGLTREKVDGTTVFVALHPSKVMIKTLSLDDKLRKAVLERKKPIIKKKPKEAVKKAPTPKKAAAEKKLVAEAEKAIEEAAAVEEKPVEELALVEEVKTVTAPETAPTAEMPEEPAEETLKAKAAPKKTAPKKKVETEAEEAPVEKAEKPDDSAKKPAAKRKAAKTEGGT